MEFITIRHRAEAEYDEKKSRFLAFLQPVKSTEHARAFLSEIKKAHPNARHHVYAWILKDSVRCSDDGEPSGTAGTPVLAVLQKRSLTCVAAVVVRYFGGVLLGASGLVRAYGHAVSAAADAAEFVTWHACVRFVFLCGYDMLQSLQRLSKQMGYVQDIQYTEKVLLKVAVPVETAQAFLKALADLSGGKIEPREGENCFEEAIHLPLMTGR